MADTNEVVKIYQLRSLGYDDLIGNLNNVNTAFERIKKTKQEADKVFLESKRSVKEETEEYKAAKKAVDDANLALLNATAAKKQATAEARAGAAIKQQEINQQKQTIEGNKIEAGSYTAIIRAQKELYALIKPANESSIISLQGNLLSFDQAIAKYKELSSAEQAFRRQFTQDKTLVGEYTTGIIQAFKQLGLGDLVGGQVTKAQERLKELNTSFQTLRQELSEVRISGTGSLEGIEAQLIKNREEAILLNQQVSHLQTELRGAGDIGNQITTGISNGFKNAKSQIGQLLLTYVGFQAAFQGILSGVDNAKELSDQTTNLEVELGKAAGGANNLVDQLAKLDTRTKLGVLEEIANIAAKAGVSEQNLLGVTQALDKIKIAFGKDFGDVEQGTESLVKLVNVFEGTDQVTGENLLRVGNAVRTLANESVASVPFLNDFSKRMAGLKGISDITLPSVLGLASGFEQFGQSAEVSASALVKIIPKLATDTEKYGAIAGLTKQAFSDLLKSNPAEALIKVAQGLTQGKAGIEDISAAFADSELGSGRITAVLGTLGEKADDFRKSIASAGQAYQDTGNITEAFTAKNNNLAATLDKISKKFSDAAGSRGFQLALTAIAGVITFVIGNLPLLIGLLGLLSIGWVVNNQAVAIAYARLILYNTALAAQRVALGALTIVQLAYNAMIALYTGVTTGATVATTLLGAAMRALPIGIILTLIGVLAATFRAFGSAVTGTTAQLRANAIQQQITADIQSRVAQSTSDQISKTTSHVQILKSEEVSLETKKKLLSELIAQSPEYLSGLTLANIATQEGSNIIDRYITSLKNKAAEEAAQSIRAEKFKKDLQLATIQKNLETKVATGKNNELGDLTDEEKEFVGSARKNFAFTASITDAITGSSAAAEALASVKAQRAQITTEIDQTDAIIKQKYADVAKAAVGGTGSNISAATKQVEVDIAALKAQLDALDKRIETFKGSQKDLNKLIADRSKIQDAYDKATGNQKAGPTFRGSRLTGEQKDNFKDIDAIKNEQLAAAKLSREQLNQEHGFLADDEIKYLEQIRIINENAINKKLALIKGKNAEERRLIAELKLDKITNEVSTNEKIFEIRQKSMQDEFDQAKKVAELTASEIISDPTSKDFQRTQAKLDADLKIIEAQKTFDASMDVLEKEFGLKSKKNYQDRLLQLKALGIQIKAEIVNNTKAGIEQQLKKTEDAASKALDEIKLRIANKSIAILNNDKFTPEQKANAIDQVKKDETTSVLANEVAAMRIQLPLYQALLNQKLLSESQYSEKVTALREKEAVLLQQQADDEQKSILKIVSAFKEALGNITGFFQGAKASQNQINGAIAAAEATVKDALGKAFNDHFNNKVKEVDADRALTQKRLDLEKAQVLSHAQSQAEKDSIDRQYQLKAEKADREAAEKKKKLALQQMTISFGIAVLQTLAEYPFPYSLIPVAGLTAAYFLQRAAVQKQQFEFGGEVPTRGGRFGGKSHSQGGTPFGFKGQQFEAEADELAVIRTKNANKNQQLSITGTHAQIASALNWSGGGRAFAPGAVLRKFEYGGNLGESLQAPVFVPSINLPSNNTLINNTNNDKILEAITEQAKAIQEQSRRIDNIQVYQVTDTVTKAQAKKVRQSNIGTL